MEYYIEKLKEQYDTIWEDGMSKEAKCLWNELDYARIKSGEGLFDSDKYTKEFRRLSDELIIMKAREDINKKLKKGV